MDEIADTTADTKPTPKRGRGRPRLGGLPPIPWDKIEQEYVSGEIVRQLDDGSFERNYPSIRELAQKYGAHRSLVGFHARRYNWSKQRHDYQQQVKVETREARAKARARSTDNGLAIVDAYLEKFRDAVERGHVRTDSIADFNTAVRLREFLLGGADSRQEIHGALTLDEMHARHHRFRAQVERIEPELAGVLPPALAAAPGTTPEEPEPQAEDAVEASDEASDDTDQPPA